MEDRLLFLFVAGFIIISSSARLMCCSFFLKSGYPASINNELASAGAPYHMPIRPSRSYYRLFLRIVPVLSSCSPGLKIIAFLCFQMHQKFSITRMRAFLSSLVTAWANQSSKSCAFWLYYNLRFSQHLSFLMPYRTSSCHTSSLF
jgi:hypothetical protein